ncbi:hypothetical protein ColKHC_06457 [Colletotrichum higginsianum]|nr:hypothetical protein ColKHC_06457 [Colletotrichum higginsianum]
MASKIPNPLVAVASMTDLDQTEICQLKQALAQVQAKIEVLEGLRDLEETEVALLRAQVDELTRLAEALRERNRRLEGELAHSMDTPRKIPDLPRQPLCESSVVGMAATGILEEGDRGRVKL